MLADDGLSRILRPKNYYISLPFFNEIVKYVELESVNEYQLIFRI